MCEENFDQFLSVNDADEFASKLKLIIERLINKDGILIVTNENDNPDERVVTVNVNYEISF